MLDRAHHSTKCGTIGVPHQAIALKYKSDERWAQLNMCDSDPLEGGSAQSHAHVECFVTDWQVALSEVTPALTL